MFNRESSFESSLQEPEGKPPTAGEGVHKSDFPAGSSHAPVCRKYDLTERVCARLIYTTVSRLVPPGQFSAGGSILAGRRNLDGGLFKPSFGLSGAVQALDRIFYSPFPFRAEHSHSISGRICVGKSPRKQKKRACMGHPGSSVVIPLVWGGHSCPPPLTARTRKTRGRTGSSQFFRV